MRVLVAPAVTSTQAPGIQRPWKTQAPNYPGSRGSGRHKHPSTGHHVAPAVEGNRAPNIMPLYASRAYEPVHTGPSRATLGSPPSLYRSNSASRAPHAMPKGASSATARQRSGAVTFARLTPYLRGIIYGLMMADFGVQDIIEEVRAHACECHSGCDAMCSRAGRGLRQSMVPLDTRQPTTRDSEDVGIFKQLLKRVCAAVQVTTIGHRQVAT